MSEASATSFSASDSSPPSLARTPLYALHCELGAKLVPFAGYEMPLQYAIGIVKEHLHVRASAGMFDVSHMGQARLEGRDFETVASALEQLVPGDILGLKPGRMRYTQLLNENGGIIDDLMVTRPAEDGALYLVVNASRKERDFKHLQERLGQAAKLVVEPDRALIALQGPKASSVLRRVMPRTETLGFLSSGRFSWGSSTVIVSRSGYTGEDGFELSIASHRAIELARALLGQPEVLPAGLGARDTLRLEAGLCLYGQDMDEETSPVEAGLSFSIGKRRRSQGGFPGAERIQQQLAHGPSRRRVGLKLTGRAAARTGTVITGPGGTPIGHVTSGAFTPTAAASIAMGYVPAELASSGTELAVVIRSTLLSARVVEMPFVPHRYFRQT